MGKKSKRIRQKQPVELYTKEEKMEKIKEIKAKIAGFGLDRFFVEEIEKLYTYMNEYVEQDIESYYEVNLPEAKRKMIVKLRNNKKYEITVALVYTGN